MTRRGDVVAMLLAACCLHGCSVMLFKAFSGYIFRFLNAIQYAQVE